jgi:heat shock protein HtpX
MYIINPLKRAGQAAANATSTHPPIDERVRILRAMGGAGFADYDRSYRQVTGRGGVMPKSALAGEGAQAPAAPPAPDRTAPSTRENARRVDDFFYRKGGYRRVDCACGTVLRVPPDFATPTAKCPRCGTVHELG